MDEKDLREEINAQDEGTQAGPVDAAAEAQGRTVRELTADEFEEVLKNERKRGTKRGVLFTLLGVAITAVVIFAVVIAVQMLGGGASGAATGRFTSVADDEFKDKADYIWAMIESHFLWEDRVDVAAAKDEMYKAMFNVLDDPYSCYYTKEEFDDMMESNSGEYSGIGAYISQNPETMELYISRPMPGSPAEEVGIVANDYIYTVDGEDVTGQDINVVVSKIKGPEGTTVDIGIKHNNEGEIEVFKVERRTIEVRRLEYEMLEDKIGYIWVYEFEQKTYSQFMDAYNELKDDGMKGLIIDLRDNPGGDLDVVCDMADVFLDEGIIVYTKEKNGSGETIKSDDECEKIPMVIMTNGNSASASEIFTGALKDRGVATVVGTNTFGKGIVQAVYSLADGTGLKITESEYYLSNDECIHGVGIAPDYEIEFDYDKYEEEEIDNQKQKAVEVMKGLLK